jgi:hypothetical protein
MSVVSGSLLWRKRTRWYKRTILDVYSQFGREGRDAFEDAVIYILKVSFGSSIQNV